MKKVGTCKRMENVLQTRMNHALALFDSEFQNARNWSEARRCLLATKTTELNR